MSGRSHSRRLSAVNNSNACNVAVSLEEFPMIAVNSGRTRSVGHNKEKLAARSICASHNSCKHDIIDVFHSFVADTLRLAPVTAVTQWHLSEISPWPTQISPTKSVVNTL